jgi:hypothetical protein
MTEIKITLPNEAFASAIVCVLEEMNRARKKHPEWPVCNVKRAAIVCEEAGEVIREANLIDEGKGSIESLRTELIQCAGTCIRMLNEISKDSDNEPSIIEYFEERSVRNG